MNKHLIIDKALNKEFLSPNEGKMLFTELSLTELMWIGDQLRKNIIKEVEL